MNNSQNITVVGSGYVGMSLAVLLSQHNNVTVLDIDPMRVNSINNKISTIEDSDIQNFLDKKDLSIKATLNKDEAYRDSNFVIIATPTDFNEDKQTFDTSSVDAVVNDALIYSKNALIIIKSTIPIGYTANLQKKYNNQNIIFSPEFLREGKALHDNLHPSRIIIGGKSDASELFATKLEEAAEKNKIEIVFMPSTEAESVKLFSNTYLAMRVSFFNELDSYALTHNLNTKHIIEGVCMDSRIGDGYNNPSFGYGGYCLPKDTKQILSNFEDIPQSLIAATVDSNQMRIEYIASCILKLKPSSVGFFRLAMKEGSDNFRSSSILGVIKIIEMADIDTYIYEPRIDEGVFGNSKMIQDLDKFKSKSELIIANRNSIELNDCQKKVFTRDIFKVD